MRAVPIAGGGNRVLVLAGAFEHEGSEASPRGSFNDVRSAVERGNYDEIWLCSGGGSVAEGYKLGRAFARRGSKLRVPAGFLCASSCTIAMMGGYLRTIDEGADFVVHSSSAASRIEPDRVFFFECGDPAQAPEIASWSDCAGMVAAIREMDWKECSDPRQLGNGDECMYVFDGPDSRPRHVLFTARLMMLMPPFPNFVGGFTNSWSRQKIGGTVEMVQYYQAMLNDGRQSAVASAAYNRAVRSNAWPHVYASETGQRSIKRDVAKLLEAETAIAGLVVWQDILTEIEVDQQRAIISLLRNHESELGRGAKHALNMLEAMITCRIQSSCYLDRNTAAQLGYHNFDMD